MAAHILLVVFFSLTTSLSLAFDPSPLQDFCVADLKSNVFVNGQVCKDPKLATAEDFLFTGLDKPGNTTNDVRSSVNLITVALLPGLNTLGLSIARLDFAPSGINVPHTHPRAAEILTVLEGTLYAGFITSNEDNNRLISKVLHKGDVFVFPFGLVHFQANIGDDNAVAIACLSSQYPGRVDIISNTVFGSIPTIPDDILAKTFYVDKKVIELLQAPFKK